jgi:hypothetical protein
VGPDWSRICKVRGRKDEAGQGFYGLRLGGGFRPLPGAQEGQSPLANPPQGKNRKFGGSRRFAGWMRGGGFSYAKLKAVVKLVSERLALEGVLHGLRPGLAG